MKSRHGLSILALSLICGLCGFNPAWAGGWESSGSRMQSPTPPTTRPATSPDFECETSIWHETRSARSEVKFEEFNRTDELKPANFVSGSATIVTDDVVDGKLRKSFLRGHSIQLQVRDNLDGPGGLLQLSVSLLTRSHGVKVVSTTDTTASLADGSISAKLTGEVENSAIGLKVTCRDLRFSKPGVNRP